jgi:DNA repair protein RecO (recombination protein O)
MSESTIGLILRTRPLTETSLIVHWLTPDFGRLATVVKGARRAKSPFLGKLDLFYLADFSFSRSRRSDLHPLREVNLRNPQSALRQDIHRLRQASYATAFIEQATETDTPLPAIFELTTGYLDCLCHHPPAPQLVLAFELKFLQELGLNPDLEKAQLTPGTKQIVRALAPSDWLSVLRLKPTVAQIDELRQFLHGFLIFHLGRLPKGRGGALTDN